MLVQRFSSKSELHDGRFLRVDFTQVNDPGDSQHEPPTHDVYDFEYSIDGVVVDSRDLPEEVDDAFLSQTMLNGEPVPFNFGPPDDYYDCK